MAHDRHSPLPRRERCQLSRRSFLGGATAAATLPLGLAGAAESSVPRRPAAELESSELRLRINRQSYVLTVDPRTLDAIRDHVGLTGTKKGCAHGQCGACTVHVEGRPTLSCLTFAWMQEGREITTIEGLSPPEGPLHPMQQAFIDHDAFQCGYCTPGQIMAAIGCVQAGHATTAEGIRERMSGNLCRCAAYPNIVAAIEQARGQMHRT